MRFSLIFTVFFTALLLNGKAMAFSWNPKITEAENNYKKGNYAQAFENYKQAQIEDPANTKLKYNLGNTAYKLGKYDEAASIYKGLAATSPNGELKEKYLYNVGNAAYKLGKLEEAENSYLDALKLDSNDLQAKKNLEKVREELKKRKKEQQDRKKNKSKQPDKKQKDKDKPDNKNKNNKDDKNNQKNKPDNKGKNTNNQPKPDSKKGDKSQSAKMKPEVSKEEAEKWLNSLKDNSQEIIRNQVLKKATQGYGSKKDW